MGISPSDSLRARTGQTILDLTGKAMTTTVQTKQALERFFNQIAQQLPPCGQPTLMSDIHVRVLQESGEVVALDDDENEITRCVVEPWIDNKDDDFYVQVASQLRQCMAGMKEVVEHLGLLKPYSYVLEDDDKESVAELYVVDDDTMIVGGDLMSGLDEDLDNFFNQLMNEPS